MSDISRRSAVQGLLLGPIIALLGPPSAAWALSNRVEIASDDQWRYIRANGIPDHAMGQFPNRSNPNSVREQDYRFRVALNPRPAERLTALEQQDFGVAVNGVPFDPHTAEFWNRDRQSGWRYEALTGKVELGLDHSNAHVQPNGAYHYHGLPKGLIQAWSPQAHSPLLGYAADGFPIYGIAGFRDPQDPGSGIAVLTSSWRLKSGERSGGPGGDHDGAFTADFEYVEAAGDLDQCNGRFCITPDYPGGTYAYFITAEFPMIPRFFKGEPDPSFPVRRGGPGMGGPGMGGPGMGGPGREGGMGRRPPPDGFGPPPGQRPPPPWHR